MYSEITRHPIYTSKFSLALMSLAAGLCWYFGNGLNGNFWCLVWIAPIPVLLIALSNPGKVTFTASFIAYLIGRLSWFTYLLRVATLVPAIIFTLLLPLIFALIVLLTRKIINKTNSWYGVFAFPVFFTAFEYLVFKFSADGTAASVAYSQADCLPLVQVASITGILGITFFVTLVPSAIALAWYFRYEKARARYMMFAAGAMIAAILLFGFLRLGRHDARGTVKAGLAVLDEKAHNNSDHPDTAKDRQAIDNYLQQAAKLAAVGARVVLFPERAISIDKTNADRVISALRTAAQRNHIYIITGYTNLRNEKERNSALVIDTAGNVILDYNKNHLVTGLESQFTPGNKTGLFKFNGLQAGVAICKDMDFDGYIRAYGINRPALICVPAWDFTVDDWLHSRMAILRGVENGFSEIRVARLGELTISDPYGRVTSRSNCAGGKPAELTGNIQLYAATTFFVRFGDWFGLLNLAGTAFFILVLIRRSRKNS